MMFGSDEPFWHPRGDGRGAGLGEVRATGIRAPGSGEQKFLIRTGGIVQRA